MLNPVREGQEDYIEAIRYRRRLKIFETFFLTKISHYLSSSSCDTNIYFGCSKRCPLSKFLKKADPVEVRTREQWHRRHSPYKMNHANNPCE